MALYKYFKPSGSLPDPRGQLSAVMSPEAIKEANEAVEKAATSRRKGKQRGSYAKFTPDQQAAIGKYAAVHGNQAAIQHFSKDLEVELKTNSVQSWKRKYQAEVDRRRKAGEAGDIRVQALPVKKRGRPLLLGGKLDSEVKSYIRAVREGGGVVTTSITVAAATAIVRKADRNLLAEHGGPITISKDWAKCLLFRMNLEGAQLLRCQ
jgi:hypothetical protein